MGLEILYSQEYTFTRFLLQRGIAFLYLMGFLIAANQGRGLLGQHGLLPIHLFTARTRFWDNPSIFYWKNSDGFISGIAWLGVFISTLALLGLSDAFGYLFSFVIWFSLWVLYSSFVNVGQDFYGFGWEILLLETGFLALFLGPTSAPVALPIIWLYRWLLFRVIFGAGLIKIRGDECWRDLTCMYYFYETQPLPNSLSWYFHHLPKWFHRFSVFYNHVVELIAPFGYFGPAVVRYTTAMLTIIFQIVIAISGNFSWLNLITIVLCIPCFDDGFFAYFATLPSFAMRAEAFSPLHAVFVIAVSGLLLYLSYKPLMNMISKRQAMNRSFDRWHLMNTYGAFGSITKERYEIILEGTTEQHPDPATQWTPYEFKGKPGDPRRRPPQVSPYHYKLDWQMWFAAMSDFRFHPWIINLVAKLLEGNKEVLGLLKEDPFKGEKPRYIRAHLYLYRFTKNPKEGWWKRARVSLYMPAMSLDDQGFRNYLREEGWLDGEEEQKS
ncbi:lipase maturation factor family protein [Bdellovibrio bacteriovorus]|uniref:lipase maturation factor family protein n=1 Tax=Bdellovibrio bacteriovorus TaxID=959 RepID=UPI0035A6FB2A